jgi:hypothetical protein
MDFSPIAFLLIVVLILWLFARAFQEWWRERKLIGDVVPKCRQCGYIVCMGTGGICAECGSDLRANGIISKEHRRPEHPAPLSALVLLLFALPALGLGALVSYALPDWWCRYEADATVKTGLPSTQAGVPGPVAHISAFGWRNLRHRLPDQIEVGWWSNQPRWSSFSGYLRVRQNGEWQCEAPPASRRQRPSWRRGPFDAAAVLEFLGKLGHDPSSPQVQSVAQQIFDEVERLRRGELPIGREIELFDGSPALAMNYDGEPVIRGFFLMMLLWLPPWWLITRRLVARYRRKRAEALAKEQETLDALQSESAVAAAGG